MKYTKVILTEKTLGLVFDRISKMMKSGIVLCENAWNELNLNPFHKNLDFDQHIKHYKNKVGVILCKKSDEFNHYGESFIIVESNHIGTICKHVKFGDTIYIGKDEIRIASGEPHFATNKHSVERLKLLTRPPYNFNGEIWVAFEKAEREEENMDLFTKQLDDAVMNEMLGDTIEENYSDEDHLYN